MSTPEPVHVAGQLDLTGAPVPPAVVARPNPERVGIEIEVHVELTAEECWPGGVPDRWDLHTLADELEARYAGDLAGFLGDWDLAAGGATIRLVAAGQPYVHVRGLA